ncbi:MAG TPA: FAD-dependent oxidoreductase [Stellaceae bacterium]|nr:FAD-dependent oxidoreductase [Stellaceae bacterium]
MVTDPLVSGPKLHAAMTAIFPELATTRISHSWCGFVAYSFDELMHIGERDGLYYAMGYCGSGVGMAGYLGTSRPASAGAQGGGDGLRRAAFPHPAILSRQSVVPRTRDSLLPLARPAIPLATAKPSEATLILRG